MANKLLHPAKATVALLLPAFTAHTRCAPQNIFRIDLALDLEETLVIVAPEGMLPVLLEWETLSRIVNIIPLLFDRSQENLPRSYTNHRQE